MVSDRFSFNACTSLSSVCERRSLRCSSMLGACDAMQTAVADCLRVRRTLYLTTSAFVNAFVTRVIAPLISLLGR